MSTQPVDSTRFHESDELEQDESRVLFATLRESLRAAVVGHDDVVSRLALAGLRHALGTGGQRLVLVGPTGSGKTTLCRALADALHVPSVVINVSQLAETNWSGFNLSDALASLRMRAGADELRMRRSLIVVDEIDKLGYGGFDGASWDYRRGKQESLLALLGGEPVRYGTDRSDQRWTLQTGNTFIVAAGVFPGLPDGTPSPADLADWGLMPELVGRLGEVIRLQPLPAPHMKEVLWRELQQVGVTADALGFEIVITDQALNTVAELATSPEGATDPRSAATLLRAAAERGLLRMLEAGAPRGARFELSEHDLRLPELGHSQRGVGFR